MITLSKPVPAFKNQQAIGPQRSVSFGDQDSKPPSDDKDKKDDSHEPNPDYRLGALMFGIGAGLIGGMIGIAATLWGSPKPGNSPKPPKDPKGPKPGKP